MALLVARSGRPASCSWRRSLLASALFSRWPLLAGEPQGRDGCPCIGAFGALNETELERYTWVDPQSLQPCLAGTPANAAGEQACYPADYGSSFCKAWDSTLPPHCAGADGKSLDNQERWCQQTWCYVDPKDCNLHTEGSKYFPQVAGLAYSYHTCDSVDMFSPRVLMAETLNGKTLRVGVPEEDSPWITRAGEAPSGFTVDFVYHLRAVGKFSVEVVPISSAAQDHNATQSIWDACTWDVALQRLDLCYGAVWATDERRAWTSFTPQYATDEFFLIVFAREDNDLKKKLLNVFGPFDAGMWCAIAVSCAGIGWSLWLFGEIDSPGEEAPGTTRLGLLKAGIRGTALGTQSAFHAFLGQGRPTVKSKPAAVVLAGFGFLCMVGAAAYTASMASFLLIGSLDAQFTDIEDALNSKAKICVPEPISNILTARYPEGASLWVTASGVTQMIRDMDAGVCSCMITTTQYYDQMQAGVRPFHEKHCRKAKVGSRIVSIPVAAPIRSDLVQAVAYLWSEARFQGYHDALMAKYPPATSDCPPMTGLKVQFEALALQDLSACFVFTWAAIGAAIFVHLYQVYGQARATRLAQRAIAQEPEATIEERPKTKEQGDSASKAGGRTAEPEIAAKRLASMQLAQQGRIAALEGKVDKIEGSITKILELLEHPPDLQ